jgi:hypothetical protein
MTAAVPAVGRNRPHNMRWWWSCAAVGAQVADDSPAATWSSRRRRGGNRPKRLGDPRRNGGHGATGFAAVSKCWMKTSSRLGATGRTSMTWMPAAASVAEGASGPHSRAPAVQAVAEGLTSSTSGRRRPPGVRRRCGVALIPGCVLPDVRQLAGTALHEGCRRHKDDAVEAGSLVHVRGAHQHGRAAAEQTVSSCQNSWRATGSRRRGSTSKAPGPVDQGRPSRAFSAAAGEGRGRAIGQRAPGRRSVTTRPSVHGVPGATCRTRRQRNQVLRHGQVTVEAEPLGQVADVLAGTLIWAGAS